MVGLNCFMNAPRGPSSNLGADGKVCDLADSAFLGASDHSAIRTWEDRGKFERSALPGGFGTRNRHINIETLLRKRATRKAPG